MNRKQYEKYVIEYMNSLPSANVSEQTIIAYGTANKRFIEFLDDIGVRNNTDITTSTIVEYRTWLMKHKVSTNSIHQYLLRLHCFFEYFVRHSLCESNPVLPKEVPNKKRILYPEMLTGDEIKKVLAEKPLKKNKIYCRNYAIVVLFMQVGLRNSELRALKLEDLDFNKCTITVKHGKGDKSRVVPFPSLARQTIQEYLQSGVRPNTATDKDYLFGINENGWHEMNITCVNKVVKRHVKKVTGKDIHCHTLRHCACSLWDELGVPIRDVQLALGHTSVQTTEEIYRHVLNKYQSAYTINNAFNGIQNL